MPGTPFDRLRENGFIVCGDPDYVAEWLAKDMETAGYGNFLGMFRVGKNEHHNVMNSERLFAEKVMPQLRHINQPSASKVSPKPPASRRRWELAVRHDTSPLPRQQLHAATRVS